MASRPPFTLLCHCHVTTCPTYLSLSDIVDMKNALDFYVTSGHIEVWIVELFTGRCWLFHGGVDGLGCGKVDISDSTLWLKPREQLENPPFWWYLPGRKGIFHGYLRCGSVVIMWTWNHLWGHDHVPRLYSLACWYSFLQTRCIRYTVRLKDPIFLVWLWKL